MPLRFCIRLQLLPFLFIIFYPNPGKTQEILGIKAAIAEGIKNYQTIKAKTAYVHAYENRLAESRSEYLPDLTLSGQQDYGTINGQYGASYGYKGLSVSSAGPSLGKQNWNSAFGALYLANINWDFFSFGRSKQRNKVSRQQLNISLSDLDQEVFQHKIRVSSAYLNLLAAQQLAIVQKSNLNRAQSNAQVIRTRVLAGLNAGVDSSLANAQVSAARILLINSREFVAEQNTALSTLLGRLQSEFKLDTFFVKKLPLISDSVLKTALEKHPLLNFYRSQINLSSQQEQYIYSQFWPTFSLFSVFQGKASGFSNIYGANNIDAYSRSYGAGVNPQIGNYLIGIGVIWNITNVVRLHHELRAQRFTTDALEQEYALQNNQLKNQFLLSNKRMQNALANLAEAPAEIKAANEAYLQKKVLYSNGLATVLDLTTAIYALNQAETDQAIASNNIWQALLYRAASTGDFEEFYNQL